MPLQLFLQYGASVFRNTSPSSGDDDDGDMDSIHGEERTLSKSFLLRGSCIEIARRWLQAWIRAARQRTREWCRRHDEMRENQKFLRVDEYQG